MAKNISHALKNPDTPDPQELFGLLHDPVRAALVEEKRLAAESADLQDFRDDMREEVEAGRATPETSERLGELTLVQAEVDGELLMSQQRHPTTHRPH